jgi:hypothetical protein
MDELNKKAIEEIIIFLVVFFFSYCAIDATFKVFRQIHLCYLKYSELFQLFQFVICFCLSVFFPDKILEVILTISMGVIITTSFLMEIIS